VLRIDILSCVPALLDGPFAHSIVARAQERNLVEIYIHNLHLFSTDKNKRIDDTPFGGGGGMVMRPEPIAAAIRSLTEARSYDDIIFLTPDATVLNQPLCNRLSLSKNLILLCGHYKGIDERIRTQFITREISIGDYVLTGGELAAAVLTDAIVRLIPGAINDEVSALTDSFQDGLLSAPVYTRPAKFEGQAVPAVLLSGHAANVSAWRHQQQLDRTKARRPDLLIDGE
jgi:tRNA (guanine37-N1)-methyltransferase